jgi:hypothetical protein
LNNILSFYSDFLFRQYFILLHGIQFTSNQLACAQLIQSTIVSDPYCCHDKESVRLERRQAFGRATACIGIMASKNFKVKMPFEELNLYLTSALNLCEFKTFDSNWLLCCWPMQNIP